MKYKSFANKIIELKEADLKLRKQLIQERQLGNGYNETMEKLHLSNSKILEEIIDEIGFPTIDKVGAAASEAARLVVQHAISNPPFMKWCLSLLENAVVQNKAEAKSLAYLSDRIAVFEGKPQHYGTQFDWNENGTLSPQPYDDLNLVNERRKSIGLNSLEEQIAVIRKQAETEHQQAPKDFQKRKTEYDLWRRKVGWIK